MNAEPDPEMAKLTGDWHPVLPKAYEKSVVLGGGLVLFPCVDPQSTAEILTKYVRSVALRSFQAGRRSAKAEIRKALHDA